MKHKVTVWVEHEKQGIFGKKTVREKKKVWVDEKTYRELKRKKMDDYPFSLDELNFYDMVLDD